MSNAEKSKSAEWYRTIHKDRSVSGSIAAATAGIADVIAAKTGVTIYVQRVHISITTDAAQTITVQDNASTPVHVLEIPASAGDGSVHEIDFGPRGFALTASEGLDISGTAGPAYNYVIDAYSRQTPGTALSVAEAAAL